MPTSAIGPNKPATESGFTLIELLIVLVIMGLLSAAVVVAQPDSRGSLTAEAQRFAARVKAAQDKAIIDGRPIALRVTETGYSFEQRGNGQWQPLATEPWSEGTAVTSGQGRILSDTTGISDAATVTLVREEEQAAVELDGSGAVDVRA